MHSDSAFSQASMLFEIINIQKHELLVGEAECSFAPYSVINRYLGPFAVALVLGDILFLIDGRQEDFAWLTLTPSLRVQGKLKLGDNFYVIGNEMH